MKHFLSESDSPEGLQNVFPLHLSLDHVLTLKNVLDIKENRGGEIQEWRGTREVTEDDQVTK